ncbi:hypothetical protein D3093_08675 [Azospirillum argentinense]|uniref:Uncharacterized protein n=1 Tax=Azospirillum argentinense TaxID=2970906 RepID=A0A4D8P918_9PROT|nr:hypothetical protein [Azospirillum argentinense]QCN95323.1 hypothetical protein D3093_08675 [Azospirillum argentinense]
MYNSEIPSHATDSAILAAALRFVVAALPPGREWPELEGIRFLAATPNPQAALAAPHLLAAALLALHRFGIALNDEGYEQEAAAADDLGFRLAG